MNSPIEHRGPDGSGVYRDASGDFSMAMRRLAILDAAGGGQPMAIDDGRYVFVFNGEIYNAPGLRADLEARGEVFTSDHSDTETLLRLLARKGESALGELDGMFAFALYDRAAQSVLLARDRSGIKPLYYLHQDGRLAFASELKCFLALPRFRPEVDDQSLFDYLSLMYVPGERTILAGIRRLLPGQSLTYDLRRRRLSTHRWWRPIFRPEAGVSRQEWAERVRETLAASVTQWSLSDVPIACSLSGGLDSSSLVSVLARDGVPVQTFSLGFTGPGEEEWNEQPLARAVARKWGTAHTEITLDPRTLMDDLGRMVWHLDEPYGGGLPSWSVFKCMSEHVKVAFTGTGGDELFGNYGKWRFLERRWWQPGARREIDPERFRRGFFERFYYFPDPAKRDVLVNGSSVPADTSEMLYRYLCNGDAVNVRDRVASLDFRTQLPEEFLMMTDRFSMAHSLEARTPFLAKDMVDLALQIPAEIRTSRRDLKGLLRRAVGPLLPKELLTAPKRGFVIPLKLWLRGDLRPLVEQLLGPKRLAAQGIFRPVLYENYVRPHLEGAEDHTNRVWAALMFQLWHRIYIERSLAQTPELDLAALAEA